MAWIPPGNFLMGSAADDAAAKEDEQPQHQVTISRGFWLMETEVTQGLWQAVMVSNPSQFTACGANCPVEGVSWCDAVLFANALSERDGLTKAYSYPLNFAKNMDEATCNARAGQVAWDRMADGYRLPTEAEWEYAARAGTQTRFWSGNRDSDLARVEWYYGNARATTHPVGQKAANIWGLRDVHGNVEEWCYDTYDPHVYSSNQSVDPVFNGQASRVFRGGAVDDDPLDARAANRGGFMPGFRNGFVGFRLARAAPTR